MIPLADYPTGERTFTINNISNAATRLVLEIARCTAAEPTIWPNATTRISMGVEMSFDNGQTYQYVGGFEAIGGVWVLRDSTESLATRMNLRLPPGTNRRLRLAVAITDGPLRTYGTLELRDD